MAADLAGSPVTVNLLLPGGPPRPGCFPRTFRPMSAAGYYPRRSWGRRSCGWPPPAAAGVHDERIVATEFEQWLTERRR
jgi:gluconate 5-dehydrogenase